MNTGWKWALVLMMLGWPNWAHAEFYKYVDKDGHVQFTDNLANVPADQRKQVEAYEETFQQLQTAQPDSSQTAAQEAANQEDAGTSRSEGRDEETGTGGKALGTTVQQLKDEATALKQEYKDLEKEQQALEARAKKRLPRDERIALDKRIADFNARLKDYRRRLDAHNKAVQAHNARIGQPAPTASP
ncbi:MAG: DUF4124 domain-containing protein [Deltaproteobacteria bacterium]|nr:DUF4124 domain-containing protein [Deltaproteobacteria bacterium]